MVDEDKRGSSESKKGPSEGPDNSGIPLEPLPETDGHGFSNRIRRVSTWSAWSVGSRRGSNISEVVGFPEERAPGKGADRRWAYRNVLGVCLSILFLFTPFFGLQNLQSSINSDQGLGLASLAVLYFFFTLFGFFSPSILKILGTKYSLTISLFCFLLFIVANFYPSWYTLVPAAVVTGIGLALVWASANSHIVEVAVCVVPTPGDKRNHLIGIFTGLYFCFVQFASIPGNLVSSLLLYPYSGHNSTMSAHTCQSSAGREFDERFLYILCAVYTLSVFVAIVFSLLMVSNLGTDKMFFSSSQKYRVFFRKPMINILKILKDHNMILLAPVSIFNGMELSFLFGSFTALVANCFGVFQVGFTLIPWGVTSALMSVVYGRAVKYVPMLTIFFFGGVINVALLIFLLLWTPTPSYPAIFSFSVLWGAADGVWNTMTTSLTGILFSTQVQSAYSALRIWLAVGFTLGFIIAEVADLHIRVWLMLAAVVLALFCVLTIEMMTHLRSPCTNPAHTYSVNRVAADQSQKEPSGVS